MDSPLHGLTLIAKQLTAYGLSIVAAGTAMRASNPLSDNLTEDILAREGRYLTPTGYELGTCGDEIGTAYRLAYLLGVPLVMTGGSA
jgi:hypothetical protein